MGYGEFWRRLWENFGVDCRGIMVWVVGGFCRRFWCRLWGGFGVGCGVNFGVGCERFLT